MGLSSEKRTSSAGSARPDSDTELGQGEPRIIGMYVRSRAAWKKGE